MYRTKLRQQLSTAVNHICGKSLYLLPFVTVLPAAIMTPVPITVGDTGPGRQRSPAELPRCLKQRHPKQLRLRPQRASTQSRDALTCLPFKRVFDKHRENTNLRNGGINAAPWRILVLSATAVQKTATPANRPALRALEQEVEVIASVLFCRHWRALTICGVLPLRAALELDW
jgi:hypothetical protein